MDQGQHSEQTGSPFLPEVRRARYNRLTIYEVEESELLTLERGSPDSIFLNISIALLTLAISFTASLLTLTITSNIILTLFIVVAVVGYVVGIILLVLWWHSRTSINACIHTIRNRLPPEWLSDTVQEIQGTEEVTEIAEQGH